MLPRTSSLHNSDIFLHAKWVAGVREVRGMNSKRKGSGAHMVFSCWNIRVV